MYTVRKFNWQNTLDLEKWLNQMYEDGWELVAVSGYLENQYFIFRDLIPQSRKKQNDLRR